VLAIMCINRYKKLDEVAKTTFWNPEAALRRLHQQQELQLQGTTGHIGK